MNHIAHWYLACLFTFAATIVVAEYLGHRAFEITELIRRIRAARRAARAKAGDE